jgi:hypothetical protein
VSRFAVVALLPEPADDATRADFVAREFETWEEVPAMMAELETAHPAWRVVTFAHVEDLPLLMEPPAGAEGES